MTKVLDCPAEPVPVLTFDIYEFDPIIGAHWDGSWIQRSPREVEVTGGFQATPDDVDHWSAQFGCDRPPVEQQIPLGKTQDGGEETELRRPVTVLAIRDCVEPIVAIGAPSAIQWGLDTPGKLDDDVLAVVNPLLLDELIDMLE